MDKTAKWVTFNRDFDWISPGSPSVTVAFKAGRTHRVTGPQAEAAIAAGAAHASADPKKESGFAGTDKDPEFRKLEATDAKFTASGEDRDDQGSAD